MILIGQYDSPFVRRVAITLRLYDLPYQHRPWSVWGAPPKTPGPNPPGAAPPLPLEDGTVLVETFAIIDALDELVPPVRALLPRSGPVRRDGLRIAALSAGVADKAASLLYEPMFREAPSAAWMQRCQRQIADTLAMLQTELATRATPYWLGSTLSHADVAFACALRFTTEAHPTLFDPARYRALVDHSRRCEERPEFRAVYQPITNNI